MKQEKTNILLITTDQQRYDTIAAAGYPYMYTPSLDRLVREGCLFEHAYSPNPTCMAARHNIVTGVFSQYHGFDDNYFDVVKAPPYDLPTFPQILADGGYDTAAFGKMHFMPFRRHNGFNHMELMEEIPRYREDDDYALFLKEQGYGNVQSIHGVRNLLYMLPQRSLLPEECHGSTWVADQTIRYLKENKGNRPFMVWSSFIEPHPPFDVPDSVANLYRGAELPGPKMSKTPLSPRAVENQAIADYPDECCLQRAKELYYAAISFVDKQIGRILDTLEEENLLDTTMIVFTSDHGEMLGDYGTYQKFLPYEESVKVPMIIRYPEKFQPGSRYDKFVDLNDLLPTFLEAAGCQYPNKDIRLPGSSLLSLSDGRDRDYQYMEHSRGSRRWVSISSKDYKYNYYYGGGLEELFDKKSEAGEAENLLLKQEKNKPELEKEYTVLRRKLIEYEAEYGLEGYIKNGDFQILEPYQIRYHREMNFPMFSEKLDPEEQQRMMAWEEEVLEAIGKEPVVRLEKLDLAGFEAHSRISKESIEKLLKK